MADLGDTKTLKALGVANNKLLDIRGGYNVMSNNPDDTDAWVLRNQCLALANNLLELNEKLSHRCHAISRAKMEEDKQDPADDLFNEDEDTADQTLPAAAAQARLEGAQAYGQGKSEGDCPYDDADPLQEHWNDGFREAKEEFEGGE